MRRPTRIHARIIVIEAYEMDLKARKEEEQRLKTVVEEIQHKLQNNEEMYSQLEDDKHDLEKKMARYKQEYEQQQKVLMEVQEKGKNHKIILPTQ